MNQSWLSSHRYKTSILLGFVLLIGCSKSDSASSTSTPGATPSATSSNTNADKELADIADYRLTMDKYDKYIAAQRNLALKAKDLSAAEKQALEARNESRNDPNASLDDMVKNIESEPLMVSAIRDAGLSPREFTLLMMSIMQTAMAAGVAKMRPNDNQDSLIREMKANPANVKFFYDNEAELTKKQKDLEAELKRLGVSTEG